MFPIMNGFALGAANLVCVCVCVCVCVIEEGNPLLLVPVQGWKILPCTSPLGSCTTGQHTSPLGSHIKGATNGSPQGCG